jgi:hypothetical protein
MSAVIGLLALLGPMVLVIVALQVMHLRDDNSDR